jgi:hypothetical protein
MVIRYLCTTYRHESPGYRHPYARPRQVLAHVYRCAAGKLFLGRRQLLLLLGRHIGLRRRHVASLWIRHPWAVRQDCIQRPG